LEKSRTTAAEHAAKASLQVNVRWSRLCTTAACLPLREHLQQRLNSRDHRNVPSGGLIRAGQL